MNEGTQKMRNLVVLGLVATVTLQLFMIFLRTQLDPSPVFAKHKSWRDVVPKEPNSLTGKTAVVTGATDGIGVETTKALVYLGARVIVGARDLQKAERVISEIYADIGKGRGSIEARLLDLSSLDSVADFAKTVKEPVDILILNAGLMHLFRFERTGDGYEKMFATNYLCQMFLTYKLMDNLAKAKQSRVVYVSSYGPVISATSREKLVMDDFLWTKERFDSRFPFFNSMEMYANSKAAGMLHMRHLAREGFPLGIATFSVHPGFMATAIGRDRLPQSSSPIQKAIASAQEIGQRMFFALLPGLKSMEEGAATTVFCATAPDIEALTGRYFEDVDIKQSTRATQDDSLAKQLFEWALDVFKRHEQSWVAKRPSASF